VEIAVVDGAERLDDRRQQDEEPPEDEEVHDAGKQPLQKLSLPEDDDELLFELAPPVAGSAVLVCTQAQEFNQDSRAPREEGKGEQDECSHDDLLDHLLRLPSGLTPAARSAV
jgi:hypothetical protein